MQISQTEAFLEKPFFRETCAIFVDFKMKPLRKSVFQC